jgi:histidyl-tRNA synthetase
MPTNSPKIPKVEPRLLKGFRDYLPQDALPFRDLISKIQIVFERFGFLPIETPTLEYADLLMDKYGAEADKLMYRFVDHGGRHVAMRYDHTVPLARLIAMNQDLAMPFKRYVLAPVWRADKPQKGRLREFYQCDVDIVGSDEMRADAEVLSVAYQLFEALGIKKFGLQVNHRGVLDALVQSVGVAKNQINGVFHAIDKFPKYGEESFVRDTAALGLDTTQTDALLKAITINGKPDAVIKKLSATVAKSESGKDALAQLESIATHALALGVPEDVLHLDLKIVRGLDYYTGMVVESIIQDLPLFGSVIGGGRYDGLIGLFAGRTIPAVGVSLGLGRLFDALKELKQAPAYRPTAKVLVAIFDSTSAASAEKTATTLRAAGINTEVFLGNIGKIDKQLRYADRVGIPLVIWQGPEEQKKSVYAAKVLATKKQQAIDEDELVTSVKRLLA